jgi:hypothetical protein
MTLKCEVTFIIVVERQNNMVSKNTTCTKITILKQTSPRRNICTVYIYDAIGLSGFPPPIKLIVAI